MTLPDLRAMLERRAAEAEAEGATAPVANVYRLVLGELAKLNGANGGPAPPAVEPDRMLTVPEVAQRLRVKPWFIYAHRKALGGKAGTAKAERESSGSDKQAVAVRLLKRRLEELSAGRYVPDARKVTVGDLLTMLLADATAKGNRSRPKLGHLCEAFDVTVTKAD